MKIGMIVPPWLPIPPVGYGGLEVVVDNLVRGLDSAGHEVLLCAAGDSTCPVTTVAPFRKHVDLPGGGVGVKHELAHVCQSYRMLEEWSPDVVHDHTYTGPLIGKLHHPDLPVVTTNHMAFGWELQEYYGSIAKDVPIVALSQHHASTTTMPLAAVIHNGTDVYDIQTGYGEGNYAVWIGRWDEEKGPHTAIDVARRLGINLKLAARPPTPKQRHYFETAIQPVLGNYHGHYVQWVGEVPSGIRKSELLGEAFCFLNPIEWDEPFGMTMIEALAHGTPVVVNRRGSAPEIVVDGETGYLCDDLADLEAAVIQCYDGSLDRQACRKDAVTRFSTRRMVRAYLELYQDVMKGNW